MHRLFWREVFFMSVHYPIKLYNQVNMSYPYYLWFTIVPFGWLTIIIIINLQDIV